MIGMVPHKSKLIFAQTFLDRNKCGIRKCMSDQSSIRLFCNGVPVNNKRRCVLKCNSVCHRWDLKFCWGLFLSQCKLRKQSINRLPWCCELRREPCNTIVFAETWSNIAQLAGTMWCKYGMYLTWTILGAASCGASQIRSKSVLWKLGTCSNVSGMFHTPGEMRWFSAYQRFNSTSQLSSTLVGTTMRCGPQIPL